MQWLINLYSAYVQSSKLRLTNSLARLKRFIVSEAICFRRESMWKFELGLGLGLHFGCLTCIMCMRGGFGVRWFKWQISKWVGHTCCSYMFDDIVKVEARAENGVGFSWVSVFHAAFDKGWFLPWNRGPRMLYHRNKFGFLLCYRRVLESFEGNIEVSGEGFNRYNNYNSICDWHNMINILRNHFLSYPLLPLPLCSYSSLSRIHLIWWCSLLRRSFLPPSSQPLFFHPSPNLDAGVRGIIAVLHTSRMWLGPYILSGGREHQLPHLKLLGLPTSLPLCQRILWAWPEWACCGWKKPDFLQTYKQTNKQTNSRPYTNRYWWTDGYRTDGRMDGRMGLT